MSVQPKPQRLQLRRNRGWRLQEVSKAVNGLEAVNVARPSKWGNFWTIQGAREAGHSSDPRQLAQWCVDLFRAWITRQPGAATAYRGGKPCTPPESLDELRGKNLACWCKPGDPCHADVLLELANRPDS